MELKGWRKWIDMDYNREIAILLATYNGEKYIELQLQSLIDQTFDDFICYVHDDNSTDKTVEIIKKFETKYPDKIKLLNYEKGHGAIGNFLSLAEFVWENTKEPYIFFCDQDDYWCPTKLEKQIEVLRENEDTSEPFLVYCDQEIVDSELNTIARSGMEYSKRKEGIDDSFKELVFENCAAGCTIGLNRSLLNIAMSYIDEKHVVMHDWWFMLIARCFGEIGYVDEQLMKYRQHGNNTLGADSKLLVKKMKKYLFSMRKSIKGKAMHVKKCEMQIESVYTISRNISGIKYQQELNNIHKIIYKNKIKRMFLFLKLGYLKIGEIFTAIFV